MKLEDWLKKYEWEQKEFAKKLGVTPSSVCKYVNGTRLPHIKIIRKIAKLTDHKVTIDDFYGNE